MACLTMASRMALNISLEEENAILRVAARIKGSRGGKAKHVNRSKAVKAPKINGKRAQVAQAV